MGPPEVRGGPEGHCASLGARTTAAPCTAGVVLGPLRSGHRAGRAGLQAAESSQLCSWWGPSRESRSREQPPGPPLACVLHPRSRGWWPARSPTLTFKRQGLHGTPRLGGGHSPCRTWHKRAARGTGLAACRQRQWVVAFSLTNPTDKTAVAHFTWSEGQRCLLALLPGGCLRHRPSEPSAPCLRLVCPSCPVCPQPCGHLHL